MDNSTPPFLGVNDSGLVEEMHRSGAHIAVTATLQFIVLLVTVVGNVSVIAAVLMYKPLRSDNSNLLIVNLSITDLASAVFVMMSTFISLVQDSWNLGAVWCDVVCALNYCLIIVSMLTLCAISLDRYQAILHPLKYHERMTRCVIFSSIGYAWFQGILFCIIPVIFDWIEYDYWEIVCAIHWHRQRERAIYYVVTAFLLCFLLPGLVLLFCYVSIARETKRHVTRINTSTTGFSHPDSNTAAAAMRRSYDTTSKRVIRSLMVMVIAYFICMTPFSLTKLVKVAADSQNIIPGDINSAASIIAYCSSAVNPLIYGIFRRDFRRVYAKILWKVTGLRTKAAGRNTQSFST
jgi:hypothetical protein